MATQIDKARATGEEGQMSLMDHLMELRKRLMIAMGAIVLGAIVVAIFFKWLMREVLLPPYCEAREASPEFTEEAVVGCRLLITDPLEGLGLFMTIVSYGGVALAMPVILWQLWRFVVPALYEHERRYGMIFVFCSTLLFILGAGLAYWSLPRALDFLISFVGGEFTEVALTPQKYLNFVVKMTIGFGIGFQFPIVLVFLQLVGLVQTDTLREGRRFAVVGITILVAVLTPSGDPFTLLAMAIPLYFFYELSILFGRWWTRRQAQAAK